MNRLAEIHFITDRCVDRQTDRQTERKHYQDISPGANPQLSRLCTVSVVRSAKNNKTRILQPIYLLSATFK